MTGEVPKSLPAQVCGWPLRATHLDFLKAQLASSPGCSRAELARRFCSHFDWRDLRGQLKLMSGRVALLKLHRLGWLTLPAARNGNGNGRALPLGPPKAFAGSPITRVRDFELEVITQPESRRQWNQWMEAYHYLGRGSMGGAQLRYWVRSPEHGQIGALGFGAAAWKVAARDKWIGWDGPTRQAHLLWVLNQARFLIAPWVQCPNLGSQILARCAQQVVQDFQERYGYRPVLLESFVESTRFAGTVYRAANWICVGQSAGRGKWDRNFQAALPPKSVWLYPLCAQWRRGLGVEP